MKIASWNVRTLLDRQDSGRPERRTALVAKELERYQVDVAALQETRMSGSGQLREACFTVFWCGRELGERRSAGVAFAVRNNLLSALTGTPVSHGPRLMSLRVTVGDNQHATFVCCYAPTLDSSDEAKAEFYQSLENILARVSPTDKLVIMGDFNARVGKDSDTWNGVLGKFGRGSMNENGLLLSMKCVEHELAITNTFFRVPDKWYGSWQHPRSKHVHLLDYIVTRRSDLKDFHSTRVMRGAECSTDHYLVRSVVAFCLRNPCRRPMRRRAAKLDVSRLQSIEVSGELRARLEVRLDSLPQLQDATVDGRWEHISSSIREIATETLGLAVRHVPDWFNENEAEISLLLEERNKAYAATLGTRVTRRMRSNLVEARRVLQRRLRELRNNWWLRKAEELQGYADARDYRSFYAELKKIYGPPITAPAPVLSSTGALLTSASDIANRWREHYELLLNCDPDVDEHALDNLDQMPINIDLAEPPSFEETKQALFAMHDGKANGVDGIPAEVLKRGGESVIRHLTELFTLCWERGTLPQDFKDARIVSIYKKKGDRHDCGNHRGIHLLSVAGKTLARLMLTRLQTFIDRLLPESQCGFRQNRSAVDMIFTLRQLQEKAVEQHRPLYAVFVDFRKAFDTVNRDTLWGVLQRFGCPDAFLDIIRQFHIGMSATVVAAGAESAPFGVRNGVRQGCVLAPTLFSLYLSAVLLRSDLAEVSGVDLVSRTDGRLFNLARLRAASRVRHVCVRELLYADDAALVASSLSDLRAMVDRFSTTARQFGLQINTEKTEVLFQPAPGDNQEEINIRVCGVELRNATTFTYLGSAVCNNNSMDTEVLRRIQAATSAFGKMKSKIDKWRGLRIQTKLSLYRAIVVPTFLYSLEACTLYRRHLRRLTSAQVWHLRQLLGVGWQDFIPNVEILQRANIPSIEALLVSANIRWAGHVVRMEDCRLPKAVMYGQLSDGVRTVGGQKLRFKDVLKRNLKAADVPVDDWEELAENRSEYRSACRDAVDRVEDQRRKLYSAAHARRHNPPSEEDAVQCPHCVKVCRGRVGLSAHTRAKHRQP